MKAEERIPEEKWQAIISNDASYDGRFIYAVKTTGIFCRPSCKSKAPNKENVRLFENAEQARSAHFRPCKRCKPTGERMPDDEWVDIITQYIDSHYREILTLDTLADMCHGSPYHLQRTFKRMKGMTPVEYIQQTRITKAKEYLAHTDRAVSDIALNVGMANTSYFITLFKKKTGRTPNDYRHSKPNNDATEVPQGDGEN
ncbi:bifunctional transcriptional activator/DNA repair enzyme AdaA [Paenibacillus sp. FJAT-27812]|uniref:bifunctional transcriptional activator/DNA repair enzyme AdaA n=1 Tax=Paenibacillus sp. FJAT-27812 TaxID=1684143 RepID=UPI000AD57B91|nr:bifunctional transcriptional activator/DNA repair enzyme AdaA [Paenibacillus sp. FJAT-27812]